MAWDDLNVNSLCRCINQLHHPWPTEPTELVDPYIKQCIYWDFHILMYHPTRRPCFCMARAHCTTYFYASSPSTGVGPGLFSSTFSPFFLHFIAKVWRRIIYSQTAFSMVSLPFRFLWWLFQLHRLELPVEYPFLTEVMVICHYVERIWRIIVTYNFLYNIYYNEQILSRWTI